MGSLQRQAQKAKRYQGLHKDLRVLDTHLGHHITQGFSRRSPRRKHKSGCSRRSVRSCIVASPPASLGAVGTRESYHQLESRINTLRQQAQELQSRMQGAEGRMGFTMSAWRNCRAASSATKKTPPRAASIWTASAANSPPQTSNLPRSAVLWMPASSPWMSTWFPTMRSFRSASGSIGASRPS